MSSKNTENSKKAISEREILSKRSVSVISKEMKEPEKQVKVRSRFEDATPRAMSRWDMKQKVTNFENPLLLN